MVTNQAGVARGYFPESVFQEVQQQLREQRRGGRRALRRDLRLPAPPDRSGEPPYREDCDCRKPRPGLLRRAEAELGADLARSWVIGDRHGDLQLAWNVGARGALVKTGYGLGELTLPRARAGRGSPTSWPRTCWRRSSAILGREAA